MICGIESTVTIIILVIISLVALGAAVLVGCVLWTYGRDIVDWIKDNTPKAKKRRLLKQQQEKEARENAEKEKKEAYQAAVRAEREKEEKEELERKELEAKYPLSFEPEYELVAETMIEAGTARSEVETWIKSIDPKKHPLICGVMNVMQDEVEIHIVNKAVKSRSIDSILESVTNRLTADETEKACAEAIKTRKLELQPKEDEYFSIINELLTAYPMFFDDETKVMKIGVIQLLYRGYSLIEIQRILGQEPITEVHQVKCLSQLHRNPSCISKMCSLLDEKNNLNVAGTIKVNKYAEDCPSKYERSMLTLGMMQIQYKYQSVNYDEMIKIEPIYIIPIDIFSICDKRREEKRTKEYYDRMERIAQAEASERLYLQQQAEENRREEAREASRRAEEERRQREYVDRMRREEDERAMKEQKYEMQAIARQQQEQQERANKRQIEAINAQRRATIDAQLASLKASLGVAMVNQQKAFGNGQDYSKYSGEIASIRSAIEDLKSQR